MNKLNYKKMPLENLIICAQQSDIKASEELIKRIQKNIYTFFCHIYSPENLVSDLTQETLIKILKNIKSLNDIKSFKNWSQKIAINTFYDMIKKEKKYNENIHDENYIYKIEDTGYVPIDSYQIKELDSKIKTCIINLPVNIRLAIILREFNGLTYKEIAKLTNSNLGTVKSRISRAREKLQTELANYV